MKLPFLGAVTVALSLFVASAEAGFVTAGGSRLLGRPTVSLFGVGSDSPDFSDAQSGTIDPLSIGGTASITGIPTQGAIRSFGTAQATTSGTAQWLNSAAGNVSLSQSLSTTASGSQGLSGDTRWSYSFEVDGPETATFNYNFTGDGNASIRFYMFREPHLGGSLLVDGFNLFNPATGSRQFTIPDANSIWIVEAVTSLGVVGQVNDGFEQSQNLSFDWHIGEAPANPVPEPSSLFLLGAGMISLVCARRRLSQ